MAGEGAELAVTVPSPAALAAVGEGGAGVGGAAGDRDGGVEARDFDGHEAVGGRAVAELAVGVVAPAVDARAFGFAHDGAGVAHAGGDGGGVRDSRTLRGRRPIAGGGAVAELARGVVAPAQNHTARCVHGTDMARADGDGAGVRADHLIGGARDVAEASPTADRA